MPGRYSFPRAARLTTKAEFRFVFERSRKVVGPSFVCHLVRRHERGSKLGIVVSRKVGGAVVRSRVKRYLREFYRTHRPDLLTEAWVVVVARPPAAAMSYRQCEQALQKLFRRGGLLDG